MLGRRRGRVFGGAAAASMFVGASVLGVAAPAVAAPEDVAVSRIVLDGTGNGHGRGLSQWGAYGYAVDHGWTWTRILDHYYGGTSLGDVDGSTRITVRLTAHDDDPSAGVIGPGASGVRWKSHRAASMHAVEIAPGTFEVYGSDQATCSSPSVLVVPNGSPAVGEGSSDTAAVRQIQRFLVEIGGQAISVDGQFGPRTAAALRSWQGSAGLAVDGVWHPQDASAARAQIDAAGSTGGWALLAVVDGPVRFTTTAGDDDSAAPATQLGLCSSAGRVTHYRGALVLSSQPTGNRVVNDVSVESYLRGVVPKEVWAGWADAGGGRGRHALRAQAVAARSYALVQNRYGYAKTCDTTSCQVYAGAARRSSAAGAIDPVEDARTDAAIAATVNKVRRWPTGRIASTEFSSSNGPRTAGGTFPPVDDLGDDTTANPHHRWTVALDADQLARRYGLGRLLDARMVEAADSWYRQFDGIWFNDVILTGTDREVRIQAWDFRNQQSLRSPGFTLRVERDGPTPVPLAPPKRIELDVVGRRLADTRGADVTVPSTAVAAALNVTAVQSGQGGWATVWPCGRDRPVASNLNFRAGDIVANQVVAPIGVDGSVCLYASASVDVVVDVAGWFDSGASLTTVTPVRVVDTRIALGGSGRISPAQPLRVSLAAVEAVRADGTKVKPGGAGAVVANLTIVAPSTNGFATAWPCDSEMPTTSNVNFAAGVDTASAAVVAIGPDAELCVHSSTDADLVVDLGGWMSVGSTGFVGVTSTRLLDTRVGIGAPVGKPRGGSQVVVPIVGNPLIDDANGSVAADAAAAVVTVTAVEPGDHGFVTVWPCGSPLPVASNVNYAPGSDRANLVLAPLGSDGAICLHSDRPAHLLVDLYGWIPSTGGFVGAIPERLVDTRVAVGPTPI